MKCSVCAHVLNHFSWARLFVTLGTVACQASLPIRFSRQEYWCGLPCPPPGALSDSGIKPASPTLQADSLLLSHWRSPKCSVLFMKSIMLVSLISTSFLPDIPSDENCHGLSGLGLRTISRKFKLVCINTSGNNESLKLIFEWCLEVWDSISLALTEQHLNFIVTISQHHSMGIPGVSAVKNPSAMQKTQETKLWSLGQEDPLEEEMATHSSIFAWGIPWTEEPGGLQSIESQRFRHDWATDHTHTSNTRTGTTAFCNWDTPATSTANSHGRYNAPGQDCLFREVWPDRMPVETPTVSSAERADEQTVLYISAFK